MPRLFDARKFEESFREVEERVRLSQDIENPRPAFDPKVAAEVAAAEMDGRDPSKYETCLRYFGFTFHRRETLPPMDGVPHPEGIWRHRRLAFAFYPSDLAKQFPDGPEQLDKWLRTQVAVRKLTKVGKPAERERRKLLSR